MKYLNVKGIDSAKRCTINPIYMIRVYSVNNYFERIHSMIATSATFATSAATAITLPS